MSKQFDPMPALSKERSRNVTESHAGVASVGVGGTPPRAHDCADFGDNAAANAEFNEAARGPRAGGIILKP